VPLSIFDRMPAQIVALDLDQVECAEGRGVIVPAIPEKVEDWQPLLIDHDGLAVDHAGLHRQPRDGVHYERYGSVKVVTLPRYQPDPIAFFLGNDPKTVVLDLMDQLGPLNGSFRRPGQARLECDRTLDAALKFTERDGHAE
jgi:hypothetical protein